MASILDQSNFQTAIQGFPCGSCIYGSSSNRGKDEFWTELYDLGNSMVFGDFNEVLYSEDRNVRRGSALN